mgnify:CR=1 FL=1
MRLILIVLLLAGCTSFDAKQPHDGQSVDTPIWGTIFCTEHPARLECKH